MGKPVILAVDDDASVLEAIIQDLRRQYGPNYRILRAGSGQAALDMCVQLQQRGDEVALFVSDQRMPGMTGVDFLEQARHLYPEARRVLLIAYADTEAAIKAINTARIQYYLTKPWDPPEERLYPVLDDLLGAWAEGYKPRYEGMRVIGPRWSAVDYQVRDFLSRNQAPYIWLDPERESEAFEWLERYGLDDRKLPVVLFPDGSSMVQPTQMALAEKIGLSTRAARDFYDLVVVGGGPAGLAGAVYAASEGLKTLLVEPEAPGGQAGSSSRIENYLGFPSGVSGADLARRAYVQASRFGVEFLTQCVTGIRAENQYRLIRTSDGNEVSCRAGLIALGVNYRRLQAPGVERLTGAGVSYGAALVEARACRGEEVSMVGGANSAGQAAMHFAQYARQVTMLVRSPSLEASMSKYLIDQIAGTSNYKGGDRFAGGRSHGRKPPGWPAVELPGPGNSGSGDRAVHLYRSSAFNQLAAGADHARSARVRPFRTGFARGRQAAAALERGARPVPAGDQHAGISSEHPNISLSPSSPPSRSA